jgi:hypothetical protein
MQQQLQQQQQRSLLTSSKHRLTMRSAAARPLNSARRSLRITSCTASSISCLLACQSHSASAAADAFLPRPGAVGKA